MIQRPTLTILWYFQILLIRILRVARIECLFVVKTRGSAHDVPFETRGSAHGVHFETGAFGVENSLLFEKGRAFWNMSFWDGKRFAFWKRACCTIQFKTLFILSYSVLSLVYLALQCLRVVIFIIPGNNNYPCA